MSPLSDYEKRYLAMLDELSNSPEIQVYYEERGPVEEQVGDAQEAFELIADEQGIFLDPLLHRTFLRFEELSCHWGVERGDVYLTGEFSLYHLAAAMLTVGVDLATDDTPEEESTLYSELRLFDDHPRGGGDTMAALRIHPGMTSPEVWYYHGTRGVFKLDLNYSEYLDALLTTKGTYGWQYLFTDVSMRDVDFQGAAENIQNMLKIFPEIFPDHDYEPFRVRLAERLR
ncbi:hypothetical protein DY245_25520 [Streptomyces inhibens]|uniref:SMI1/KNR4 family protein n=1 Tax=Streptomyces inhibens TaxID=2293571 RepID=A0A371PYT4_STRIH|nr:hypothetical protein DY245_25520 [Streptomyces inhibens]